MMLPTSESMSRVTAKLRSTSDGMISFESLCPSEKLGVILELGRIKLLRSLDLGESQALGLKVQM